MVISLIALRRVLRPEDQVAVVFEHNGPRIRQQRLDLAPDRDKPSSAATGPVCGNTSIMNLLDIPQADAVETIDDWVTRRGDPAYRGRQIAQYLWQRPAGDWTGSR